MRIHRRQILGNMSNVRMSHFKKNAMIHCNKVGKFHFDLFRTGHLVII